FPQAVGVAVMKIKSFGLMVDAVETRVSVVGTKVLVWIASLSLAMAKMWEAMTAIVGGVTFLPTGTLRGNVVCTKITSVQVIFANALKLFANLSDNLYSKCITAKKNEKLLTLP
ncbi:MAG: hypothetical protein LBR28_01720, partial [Bacteroidales bacterium]|nr:hypothetical protein [Bacteroidales bacterium]